MAELLVMNVDKENPDPIISERYCYKRGDIVVVMEDGHKWGSKEGPPMFIVLKMPGVQAADVQEWLAQEIEGEGDTVEIIRRRAKAINLAQLPTSAKMSIQSSGRAAMAWQDVDRALYAKRGLHEWQR